VRFVLELFEKSAVGLVAADAIRDAAHCFEPKRTLYVADLSKLVNELSNLTVLQAAELAKILKEKWGRGGVVKAYLDNNVVSAIAKDDTPAESDALDRLLAAYKDGKVDLVTSELTLEEIKPYQGQMRPAVERTFRLLEKVPIVRWDELMGINSHGDKSTWINTPMIQNDPMYGTLLAQGVKNVDAQHVFVAAKNGCDAFLTCDKGVLHRSAAIEELCNLAVQKPSGLVASHGW
jgi:hypothetical protein